MKHEGNDDTNSIWWTQNNRQRLGKCTGRFWIQRASRDHPDYSIVKIGQNTEKSPGDLIRLSITQTPVKGHQQELEWKNRKELNENHPENVDIGMSENMKVNRKLYHESYEKTGE